MVILNRTQKSVQSVRSDKAVHWVVMEEMESSIEIWLGQLGLEQYVDMFLENDLDMSVLSELDHDLLKEVGVTSVGHRLKILKASQFAASSQQSAPPQTELRQAALHSAPQQLERQHVEPTGELPETPDTGTAAPVQNTFTSSSTSGLSVPDTAGSSESADSSIRDSSDPGERKQITVMFCDMVGSTRLSTLYDPEDYTVIIKSYHATCTSIINRYDGYVARYMGDGVLAYFGYPQSHENNAERAIRSALEAVKAIATLEPQPGLHLQCRIGIATGLVVVGEKLVGSASESVASGDTPNLAARLQSVAEPDQIVVAESTRRLCGDLFHWAELGTHSLKGFSDPVPAYAVTPGDALESRFSATRHQLASGIVGRDLEIALLHDRWQSARNGDGQMVLISGEAGLGKSRVVHETASQLQSRLFEHSQQIEQTEFEQANLQCSPYHMESALYPVIDYFSRKSGLLPSDSEAVRREKLLATFSDGMTLAEADLALLLQLNSTQSQDNDQDLIPRSAAQRKQRTLDLLVNWFARLSKHQPLLMVIEDVHWMDPTTHAFLLQLLDTLPDVSMLVIATARPSLTYDFGGHTAVTQMALNRLARNQMNEIVNLVTKSKSLPSMVTRDILDKADGIPLYVEELTRYVLESGRLQESETSYKLIGAMQKINIPATLYDSLSARLDRLGDAKEIAQVGAVIGREFNLSVLQAVLGIPEENLLGSLMILMNIGLLARKSHENGTSFLFKHALMRDAAYQGLLYSRRRHWHRRIANTIRELFPSIAETQPELLAQHFSDAGMVKEALSQWHLCASKNLEKFNNLEAAEQAGHGLELLTGVDAREEHALAEIDLQLDMAYSLRASEGYSAPGSESAFTRAYELASIHQRFDAMSASATGLCSAYHVGGQMRKAHDIAVRLGQDTQIPELVLDSNFLKGQILYSMGEPQSALHHYDETIEQNNESVDNSESSKLRDKLFDRKCASWQYMQRCKLLLGFPDQADDLCEKAVARAFELDQTIAKCATLIGQCLNLQRTARDPSIQATRLEAITDQHQVRYWRAWASYCNGVAAIFHGSYIEAERLIMRSVEAHRDMDSSMGIPTILGTLGEAYQHQRLYDKALVTYDEAITIAEHTEEHCDLAELYRLRGECLLSQGSTNDDQAINALQQSLSIARDQQARWWELLTATSLANVRLAQGNAKDARQELQPVLCKINEGFELDAYRQAQQLIERCNTAHASS